MIPLTDSVGVPVMRTHLAAHPAAVRFGNGRRPEQTTLVQVAEFDGPLALLLALIESRKLDVLTVPLGALADAYLDALGRLTADRLDNVSAFVAVASQLILIKSRAMLPRQVDAGASPATVDDGVDPEAELRARLILYRVYRDAGIRLADDANRRIGLFRREPRVARAAGLAGARPGGAPTLDPHVLVAAVTRLSAIAPPSEPPAETLVRTITLADRAAVIRAALRKAPSFVLQELLAGIRNREVIAITFLAMLELVKRREIVVDQAEPWGPIVARATTADERAAIVPAIVPEGPLDETLGSFA